MRFKTNLRHLIDMMAEIQNLQNSGSILAVVNASKFADFFKNNKIRADTAIEKVHILEKEFFVFENGNVKIGEDKKPVLLEGKTYEEVIKLTQEIMSQEVVVVS